eukprot:1403557-Amphidinium_carterae.1
MSTMTWVRITSLTAAIHVWLRSKGVSIHTGPTPVDAGQDQHSYAPDMRCGVGTNSGTTLGSQ